MFRRPGKHALLAAPILAAIFYVACGGGGEVEMPPCISISDCPTDFRCINNICFPPGSDAGPIINDAGPIDAGPPRFDASGDVLDSGTPPGDDSGTPPGEDSGTPPMDDAGMTLDAATSGT